MNRRWVWPTIWAVVITGELVMAWDWFRSTEQGRAFLDSAKARYLAKVERLKGCTGCARRKAALQAMVNRVHWDATRIVEGEDVPTVPEPEP